MRQRFETDVPAARPEPLLLRGGDGQREDRPQAGADGVGIERSVRGAAEISAETPAASALRSTAPIVARLLHAFQYGNERVFHALTPCPSPGGRGEPKAEVFQPVRRLGGHGHDTLGVLHRTPAARKPVGLTSITSAPLFADNSSSNCRASAAWQSSAQKKTSSKATPPVSARAISRVPSIRIRRSFAAARGRGAGPELDAGIVRTGDHDSAMAGRRSLRLACPTLRLRSGGQSLRRPTLWLDFLHSAFDPLRAQVDAAALIDPSRGRIVGQRA